MKKAFLYVALALAFVAAVPAHAQSGCVDSPENPTLILAGLAGGVYGANALRMRIRARRTTKNQ